MKIASFLIDRNEFRADLRLSLFEGWLFALMVGFGETYLIAYAVASGVSESLVGLLGSVPLLIGACVQLVSPRAIHLMKSFKRWVVFAALIQAISFIPLIIASSVKSGGFWVVFFSATLYWTAGFAAGPAWNAWIHNLVSKDESAKFFATRHRLTQFGILTGVILGGLMLDWQGRKVVGPMFAVLFFLALIFRLLSVRGLQRMHYQDSWLRSDHEVGIRQMLGELWPHHRYRSLFLYLFLLYVASSISSPFVVPYLLAKLHLSWAQFMIATATLLLGKVLFLPIAKKIIETHGIRAGFILGAFGVSPTPILWAFSKEFYYILLLQIWGGAMWGLLEVSLMLIFFDRIKPQHKTAMLSLYNLFNSSAVLIGAAIGGKLLSHFGEDSSAYLKIFIIGGVLRLLFSLPLLKTPDLWIQQMPVYFRIFGLRQGINLSLRSFLEDEVEIVEKKGS